MKPQKVRVVYGFAGQGSRRERLFTPETRRSFCVLHEERKGNLTTQSFPTSVSAPLVVCDWVRTGEMVDLLPVSFNLEPVRRGN